jgi:hypothetical protein
VNKKKQKNFDFFEVTPDGATQARSGAKVFWFFFSKKNNFLACRTASARVEAAKNKTRLSQGGPNRPPFLLDPPLDRPTDPYRP